MKIHKTLIITITIAGVVAGTLTAAARWKLPISPGDYVIDLGRLADSIRVTKEWVKQAVQQAQMLTNQIMINTGIAELGKDFISIKDSISDTINSTNSVFNTARGLGVLQSNREYTIDEAIKKFTELTGNIQADTETLIQDSLSINSTTGNQNKKSDEDLKKLASDVSPGLLAEKQKANALAIIQAQKMIEEAKLTYTAGVRDLVVTNLEGKQETLAEAANVQMLVKPLTAKQLKQSEKNNIGLLRIK